MLRLKRLMLLLPWVRRKRANVVDEELNSHLAMAAEDAQNSGLSPENARFAARKDLGSLLYAKESVRDEWLWPCIERIGQDVRYGLRTLGNAPIFTCVAIVSLALGIGTATAVFSLVEGVILKPLTYRNSGRLLYVREVVPAMERVYGSIPVNIQQFTYWHDHNRTFQAMSAFRGAAPTLTGSGAPVILFGVETTADLFRVLEVQMERGRDFLPDEDKPGKNNVAIITDGLWKREFRSDENIIGRSITLEGKPVTIVGVLPADFTFPKNKDLGALAGLSKRTELYQPLQEKIEGWDGDYDYICIGRQKEGIAETQSLAELKALTAQMIATYQIESRPRPECRPLQEAIAGPVRPVLTVLFAAVMTLLLIVCANLANLLLARASARSREFSIRTAIGAGRERLAQQIFTETVLLALAGGAFGVVFAVAAIRLFVTSAVGLQIPRVDEIQTNGTVLLFSSLLTAACVVLCGVIPAHRAARSDPHEALRSGSHTVTTQKQSLRVREILVGVEVALGTVLLFFAGLLVSSLSHLTKVDKGFQAERAIAVDLGLSETDYQTPSERNTFFDRALQAVRALPGVKSAGMISGLPLTGETMVNGIETEGSTDRWFGRGGKDNILINVRFASPGYFETLAIPVLKGRGLEAEDRERRVAVVSERLAAKVWPGQNPIGKKFKTGSEVGQVEVVGVARDTYNGRLEDGPTLIAYVPYWLRGPNYGTIVVRSAADPAQFMNEIQRTIWSIDSRIPVPPLRTMSDVVNEALAQRRFQMSIGTAFGAGALALALIGIYGVVAYNVSQRRAELGLRLALGASRSGLLAAVLGRAFRPVFCGLGSGLLLYIAISRFVRSLLFGVTPLDPLTISIASLLVLFTALAACFLPARKAITMDALTVLRYE